MYTTSPPARSEYLLLPPIRNFSCVSYTTVRQPVLTSPAPPHLHFDLVSLRMLDVFQAHGHNEVDTAIAYASGTSEEYLGKIDWLKRGIKVDTKLWPATPGHHNKANLRKYLEIQLNAVKAEQGKKQLELWYLRASLPLSCPLSAALQLGPR